MIDLEYIKERYFFNGYDVPYQLKKGDTLFIKPILVKDYEIYRHSKYILEIDKNNINDINVIQMTYLDFLYYLIKGDNTNQMLDSFSNIIKFCFGEEYFAFDKDKNKTCIILCDSNKVIKKVISSKEFDEIKKIILSQNDSDYKDRYISQDVREAYDEYCRLKYRNISVPSTEKMKAFVMSKSGYTLEYINNLPYRLFSLIYKSAMDSDIYIGQKIIQGSYKYKVEQDIIHPQYEKEKDPIAEMFSDADSFKKKIQQVNG